MSEKKQRPQDKWNAAHGLVSVSYKLNKDIADQFAEACKKIDKSKKSQLERLMMEFVRTVNEECEDEKLYLIFSDTTDDPYEIAGYIKGTSEDADAYCDANNSMCKHAWEKLAWQEIEEIKKEGQ